IWLGYTKALAFFFILSVTFYLAAIPLGIVGCFLLKKNRPKAMPILPVVVCAFLAVLPMSQIYSHISQGFEVSITSSQPTGIIPQPAPPEIGISPLRKTIAPSFKNVSEAIPNQTNGLIRKDEAQ
ncbi:MAG: hypothetical protein IE937_12820, partial [Gammaproteobacteria bacterium]|nr:hypothetical protein [Gammaproteobacteria bacterium]